MLLESVRERRGLLLAAFAATAGYAWLVGPLLWGFEANSGLRDPAGSLNS
jgi:hypothetical protein